MAQVGRPPKCTCGSCQRCKHAAYMREWYRAKTPDQRRAWIALRDKERVAAADAARYYRDPAKHRARVRAWEEADPEKARRLERESSKRYRTRNPEKKRAHAIVQNEIRRGRLVRGVCEVCGATATHAHHEDYSKPLDVRWLCHAHHMALHRKRVA